MIEPENLVLFELGMKDARDLVTDQLVDQTLDVPMAILKPKDSSVRLEMKMYRGSSGFR